MTILAKASLFSLLLAIVKLVAFLLSGSMIVFVSCIDSFIDGVISYVNHRIQLIASATADQDHPFGHGGFEVATSLVQGAVIGCSGVMIVIECFSRLLNPTSMSVLNPSQFPIALATMLLSALAGLVVHRLFSKHLQDLAGQKKDSVILRSDDAHYLSDFFVNLTGAAGIFFVLIIDAPVIDAVFGLVGGLLVIKAGVPIVKKGLHDVLHTSVAPEIQERMVNIVIGARKEVLGIHRLRTREWGSGRFIDFHLKLPFDIRLDAAHQIGEDVKTQLRQEFPDLDINIHLDPDNEPDDEIFDPKY